jgi:ABC-type transporter Mla subunit MlaD
VAKFDSILNERDLKIRELEKTVAQLSHAHDMAQKDLGKLKSHESKLVKELNQAKIDLNSLSETCTRQKLDYEMELSEISLNLNAQLQEFNEKSRTNEEKIQEYERLLAQKSSKIEELTSIETRLKEELEAKENTIMILKNSLIVKNVKGYLRFFQFFRKKIKYQLFLYFMR